MTWSLKKKVIFEIKSVEIALSVHKKQMISYRKLTGLKLGLLMNFNVMVLKQGITRVVNNL